MVGPMVVASGSTNGVGKDGFDGPEDEESGRAGTDGPVETDVGAAEPRGEPEQGGQQQTGEQPGVTLKPGLAPPSKDRQWALTDSNRRPLPCKGSALAN
jgi:hypothetical protein